MKVKNLIKLLETKDQEKEVLTPGFDEFGFCDVKVTDERVRVEVDDGVTTYQAYYEYEDSDYIDCYIINYNEETNGPQTM